MKRRAMYLGMLSVLVGAAVGMPAAVASADELDDFEFSSFDGVYELSTDADGRSVLEVQETLVAVFPPEQNRGIRRELVDRYDGHPTDLRVLSVTDENGDPREYETEDDGDFEVVTIAGDDFVEGEQTYVITYEQHNVTRYFDDTDADEFYWDVNGTGWAQPFGVVTARVVLEPELQRALTDQVTAVSGAEGDSNPVESFTTADGYEFTQTDLGPGENLTFAIGFDEGTFVPRDGSFGAAPWPLVSVLLAGASLLVAGGAALLRRTRLRDAPGRGIIVAEYLPPKGVGVLLASTISGTTTKATTAQILALAVARNLRIVEVPRMERKKKSKPEYHLEFLTAEGADADSLAFLHAIFGDSLDAGETRDLAQPDAKAVTKISALQAAVTKRATADGYRRALPVGLITLVVVVGLLVGLAAIVFSIVSLVQAYGGFVPVISLTVGALAIVATVALVARQPLEPKGVEVRDHLRGLKVYIALAEADRLRYLQSPQGAERVPVNGGAPVNGAGATDGTGATDAGGPIDPDDTAQVLRLNERLLPYAVLFGAEKEWVEEIGRYYERLDADPYWYYGQGHFNAAIFASSIGSVSTSLSSSYSSSSGGSAGGCPLLTSYAADEGGSVDVRVAPSL
ncbi:DUF2207 domain-containing protein [Marisediminicola senii]|uniref:DUF2207 domain-containing protein n=1 Tax=Marisediminicola senii TaxID=2711233 RepID=UPI0013EA0D06|nr:DUF2207 domain-containing protein [Marisediminicola senii]